MTVTNKRNLPEFEIMTFHDGDVGNFNEEIQEFEKDWCYIISKNPMSYDEAKKIVNSLGEKSSK